MKTVKVDKSGQAQDLNVELTEFANGLEVE